MNRKKSVSKRFTLPRNKQSKSRAKSGKHGLVFLILRSFLAGVGVAGVCLCLLAEIFSVTALPLGWAGPAACGAAALGTFVSGMVLSAGLPRGKLLAGLGFGVFYCMCALMSSLLTMRVPVWEGSNISLLLCLLFGALAGGAAGAMRTGSTAGVR